MAENSKLIEKEKIPEIFITISLNVEENLRENRFKMENSRITNCSIMHYIEVPKDLQLRKPYLPNKLVRRSTWSTT